MSNLNHKPVIKNIPLKDIKPYSNNPRKKQNITKVVNSIKEFGFQQPIVVDKKNIIIVGHSRYEAGKELGLDKVPVIIADLSPVKAKAYRIADNRINQDSEWDFSKLTLEFKDISKLDFNLDSLGFEKNELDDLIIDEVKGFTDDDAVPDKPKKPKSKLGEIYQLGHHRLMCGDSTKEEDVKKLMNSQKADMVFTDPPYGILFKDNAGNKIQKNDDLNDEELLKFNQLWQENAYSISSKNCFLLAWQSPRKFHLLDYYGSWRLFRLVTMYKSNRISFPHGAWINKTEPCCVFVKGNPKPTKENYLDDCYVYKHDKESHEDSNVGHPTPKPVKMIIEHITACIKRNQLAIDLFSGSGSTLIACEKLNRKCFGMELDPIYVDVIIKRWEDYTGKSSKKI